MRLHLVDFVEPNPLMCLDNSIQLLQSIDLNQAILCFRWFVPLALHVDYTYQKVLVLFFHYLYANVLHRFGSKFYLIVGRWHY
jgi:hypothetical protein